MNIKKNYNEFNNDIIYKLMQKTSAEMIINLEKYYNKLKFIDETFFAVYGSLARYEMLPMSDLDLIILTKNNLDKEKFINQLSNLNYDFLDYPSENFFNIEKANEFAHSNSPDGHLLAYLKIGDVENNTAKIMRNSKNIAHSKEYLMENLVFNYNYMLYNMKLKVDSRGDNLKYSNGATRDIVYFDWFADYLFNGEICYKSQKQKTPNILLSIDVVSTFLQNLGFSYEETYSELFYSINVVNQLKHQALMLKQQKLHFDGLMSDITACEILKNFSYPNINNPNQLILIHKESKNIVSKYKDILYNYLITDVLSEKDDCDYKYRIKLIHNIWNNQSDIAKEEEKKFLLENQRFPDLMTLLCSNAITPEIIDEIVDIAIGFNSYSHILRVAIKHPLTSCNTLKKIYYSNLVAGCDTINSKYIAIMERKLKL